MKISKYLFRNYQQVFTPLNSFIFSFGILSPKLVPDTNLQTVEKPLDFVTSENPSSLGMNLD